MKRSRRETSLSGRRLGEFVVEEKLGEGGFGVVYRATQPLLERAAVVKVLHSGLRATAEVTERFLREARLASRLDHPYAAHIYAFGAERDGILWIAMELVRGSTLTSYLHTHGRLPLERFVPLLERICEVVHTAHTQGIVHRDIKPSNVMVLSRAGRLLPKLLDFGIAKSMLAGAGQTAPLLLTTPESESQVELSGGETVAATGELDATQAPAVEKTLPVSSSPGANPLVAVSASADLTAAGAVMGSPHYMAPEQWTDAAAAGPPSDLYAIAILAYEALTGSLPFKGNLDDLRKKHIAGAVPAVGAHLPAALDEVFARALAKVPGERFEDALEMAAAFRDASGLLSHRRPLPQIEEPVRERFLAEGPQPLAEAVASLESAREPRQARDALWIAVDTLARYVTVAAVAASSRPAATDPSPAARSALRRLGTGIPETDDWLEIAQAVAAPHADQPDLHPIPELVRFLWGPGAQDGRGADLFARLQERRATLADAAATEDAIRARLAEALAILSALLRESAFVCDYGLVVASEDGIAEQWSGVRRARRTAVVLQHVELKPGKPVLLDRDGAPVLSLHPLVQVAPPSPGQAAEMFLYAGRDGRGARLTAAPLPFVHHDPEVLEWLRLQLAATLDTADRSEAEESSPYLGLRPFSVEDARLFIGRERQIEAFVNRLQVQPLLAVVGQSGAGKSSFVQAGVIPALGPSWRAITLRPGAAPMTALAVRLRSPELVDEAPEALGELLRQDAAARGPVVLVIDQLEELFTLCGDREQRQRFAVALASAASTADDPVRVILTLRDDFLVQAESLGGLRERLTRGLQLLTTPAAGDLERMMSEPARRAGYQFEDPGLPARMVGEVAGQPGALALLSFTAARLWERRDRHFKRIPSRAYEAIGGVGGALAQHAEALLESLPADRRGLVRRAFLHLVTAEGTRAVLSREELRELCGGKGADTVIETLIEGRLLVASESEQGEDEIEIIHEALLSAWPRLTEWRREAADGARLRDQLRGAVRQWEERGRPRSLLWRDELLADLERWRASEPALTSSEVAFADASRADAARGRRLRRSGVTISLAVLSAGVVLLLWLNSRVSEQRAEAEAQRERAEAQRERAESNLVELYAENGRQALLVRDHYRAAAFLSAAYSGRGEGSRALHFMLAEALRPIRDRPTTLEHGEPLSWLSFSPDGSRLVSAGIHARQPKVWSVAGELLYALPAGDSAVRMAVFDDSGSRLAIAGADGVARVFRATDGSGLLELGHGAPVRWVSFDPSGDRLATGGARGETKIWRLPDGVLAATFGGGAPVDGLDWSADGRRLVTASVDGTVAIWDPARGSLTRSLIGHRERVFRVSYHRDRVVTASFDGSARIWNPATGESVVVRHGAQLFDAALDTTGERLATAAVNGTAKLWDASSGRLLATLEGHRGLVFSAAFSPDGQRLLTTSWDGSARVWDRDGTLVGTLAAQSAPLYRGAFDPTGQRIAIAGKDGAVRVWSASLDPRVKRLPGHEAPLRSISYSTDGERLVSTSVDGTVRITDVNDGTRVVEISTGLIPTAAVAIPGDAVAVAHGDELSIVEFTGGARSSHQSDGPIVEVQVSPAGDRLVSVSGRSATVWRITGKTLEKEMTVPGRTALFDPRGQLVTGPLDGSVVRWDPATRTETLRIASAPVQIAFPCSGDRVLGVTDGGAVIEWDAATGARLRSSQLKPHHIVTWADPSCELGVVSGDGQAPTVIDLQTGRPLSFLDASQRFFFMLLNPAGTQMAIASLDGIVLWDLELATESPEEIEALVRCTVPYRVDGANLVPSPLAECPGP